MHIPFNLAFNIAILLLEMENPDSFEFLTQRVTESYARFIMHSFDLFACFWKPDIMFRSSEKQAAVTGSGHHRIKEVQEQV